MERGFKRDDLKARYDVEKLVEDDWHTYEGEQVLELLLSFLPECCSQSPWLLNAGAGVYRLGMGDWREITLDLFPRPIEHSRYPVCGTVERLPIQTRSIGAVVCVGEVLNYCDPTKVLTEFSRVLVQDGNLIIDFSSSRSPRYWLEESYAKAARLVTDTYNGTPERTWVYSPEYIETLLVSLGFRVVSRTPINAWSALAKRLRVADVAAIRFQRRLKWIRPPATWADLMMIEAVATGTWK